MNRHDYAVLTLRGFAIYAWFHALDYFTSGTLEIWFARQLDLYHGQGIPMIFFFGIYIQPVMYFAIGFLLFMRSNELASWLMPAPEEVPAGELAPHPLPAASVAFAAVGVAIFLHALPLLLNPILTFLQATDAQTPRPEMSRSEIIRIICAGVQMVFGFFLFLKARVFATAWWGKQQREEISSR